MLNRSNLLYNIQSTLKKSIVVSIAHPENYLQQSFIKVLSPVSDFTIMFITFHIKTEIWQLIFLWQGGTFKPILFILLVFTNCKDE